MSPDDDKAYEINRQSWDERVDAHFASPMYQQHVRKLHSGSQCIEAEHVRRMGDVTGKKLIHLQCHMGMETLSWARLGARVTGVDFSRPAIERANELAATLAIPAEFFCASVYDAPRLVTARFDIVFVSVGSICWLPDVDRWASVVATLLTPGGKLYMDEVHPFTEVLEDHPTEPLLVARHPYFCADPLIFDEGGTYADKDATFEHNKAVTWVHPLSAVVNALIAHGLTIRALHESAKCVWPRFKRMREINPNLFDLTGPLAGKLPMTYTLIAEQARGS